jgi:DNA-binding LacI/PurR family transcriptional regulator
MKKSVSVSEPDMSLRPSMPRARVVQHIRRAIENGIFVAGQPLPSARTLAQELMIDRATVTQALIALDTEGVIYSTGGKLRFVTQPVEKIGWPLEKTVVWLTRNPEGAWEGHRHGGWSDNIDQGVLDGLHRVHLHHLTFHQALLTTEEWSRVLAAHPHGIIVSLGHMDRELWNVIRVALQTARQQGIPVVVYGDKPQIEDFDSVASNHEQGAYEVATGLLNQGRRNIRIVSQGEETTAWFKQRHAGYERALREAGLDSYPLLSIPPLTNAPSPGNLDLEARYLMGFLYEYLREPNLTDALMLPSDSSIFAVAKTCRMLGVEPNQDVLLAGYDNYWMECSERMSEDIRPILTVDKRNHDLGLELVNLLMERKKGTLPTVPQHRLLKPILLSPIAN